MIISAADFDFSYLEKVQPLPRFAGRPSSKQQEKDPYANIITAFDIETSRIPSIEQSIMYIWQWQFGHDYTVIGRSWDELAAFMHQTLSVLEDKKMRMVVYVHNLSYEFQFLRAIIDWDPEEVFAVDSRRILKACHGQLEFRCSYLHSNMRLGEYLNKMGTEHRKLDGDEFDYGAIRYPWTPLTEKQLEYCVNDVLGLVEAIDIEMQHDGDNLYTIPLTSTGYVRRDVKEAMSKVGKDFVKRLLPDFETYMALREAFRGGNTHANRYFVGDVVENVKSADRSSSYPDVQVNCKFPMSAFKKQENPTSDMFKDLIYVRGKAVLGRIALSNVRLRDKHWGCPYLAIDKCRSLVDYTNDNGRVLKAKYLETTVTDIDFRIIAEEYEFDDFLVLDCWYARYGYLPEPLKTVICNYYRLKTELKGVHGSELLYTKSKNKLNSIYGMSATNPAKLRYVFRPDSEKQFVIEDTNLAGLLAESNEHAFFSYAWGVWTTAWARYRLEEGIRMAGRNFVYCDTDSVKYVGDIDWTDYNKEREASSTKNGAYATDPKGETHYMGVYEADGHYEEFKTWGAKKYCYVEDGELYATIAGVSKDVWAKDENGKKYRKVIGGAGELEERGAKVGKKGIDMFEPDFVFEKAGGTDLIYNDNPRGTVEADGHSVDITPNVVIKDGFYTLSITLEFAELLKGFIEGEFIL